MGSSLELVGKQQAKTRSPVLATVDHPVGPYHALQQGASCHWAIEVDKAVYFLLFNTLFSCELRFFHFHILRQI